MQNTFSTFWASLDSIKILALRQELISYLRQANLEGKMSKSAWGVGKGLVFTAGNADTFSRVLTTLRLLNNHFNTTSLPVEIFSFKSEIPTEEVRNELESFGAKLLVVEDAIKDVGETKSYHIKAVSSVEASLYFDRH